VINFFRRNYFQIILYSFVCFGLIICSLYYTGIFSSKNILFFFAIPLIIFIIYKPFWGLCLYAFMIPLEIILQLTESFTILKFFGIFILIGWILQLFISKQKLYISKPIILSLLLVTWGLISSLWATRPDASLSRFVTFILVVGSFFLVTQIINNKKKLYYIILAYVLGAMISGGFGLYNFIQNPNQRIVSFVKAGQNPGGYGISIFLGIIYFFIIYLSKPKGIIKIISLILSLILLIVAFASITRTFILSVICSFLFLLWFLNNKAKKIRNKLLFIIPVLIIIIILIMPSIFFTRVSSIFGQYKQGWNRGEIWNVYGTVILDHPLLGIGLENGHIFYGDYRSEAQRKYGIIKGKTGTWKGSGFAPHNDYILVFAELGLIGFVLWISLLISLYQQFYKSISKTQKKSFDWWLGLIIGINFIAIILLCFGEPILYKKYLWFGFSLIPAYSKIINNSIRK